jgi:hypothetical protein
MKTSSQEGSAWSKSEKEVPMGQVYSNPARADDPHALPNIETFRVAHGETVNAAGDVEFPCDEDGDPLPEGWYWQACFPGCLPDGPAMGPFDCEADAIADAQAESEDA